LTEGGIELTEHALDAWSISAAQFPTTGTPAEKLRFLVGYAILAPSSHNAQPWLFGLSQEALCLYADRTRALPVVDPEDRELTISCGAALGTLRVALHHFGYAGQVELFPDPHDPDLLARVRLGRKRPPAPSDTALFDAIPTRHTNRQPFEQPEVPSALQTELEGDACTEGAWLQLVQGPAARNAVADLVAEGDRMQWADPRFRRELAAWIHPRRQGNGLSGYAFGIGPLIVRTFDMGKGQAAKDEQLAAGSPVLAILGTDGDSVADWLTAGQALSCVLLRAAVDGVASSFLNQPIEVEELRPRLRDTIGHTGFPQLLLRMGYGPAIPPAPRRPVSAVLLPGEC
jgi:hypothetical protein